MPGDRARVDARFPNLRADLIAGYLNAPEHVAAEVIDGELLTVLRPRRPHARATTRLTARPAPLHDPHDGDPGGRLVLDEPELRLGPRPDFVVRDLAGWRRARVPTDFFADDAPAYIDLVPDWICEVLSPSMERTGHAAQMRIDRREGIPHPWVVDPTVETLEVDGLEYGRYSLVETYEGHEVVRAEPFEAIALPIGALWGR